MSSDAPGRSLSHAGIRTPDQPQNARGGDSKPHPGSLGCYASHPSAYSRRQNHSSRPTKVDSKRIAAASAANASGFLQTALSKVTRRSVSHPTRASQRRVTPDKVLTSGRIYPDHGPSLVKPMDKKGIFPFPSRLYQAKWFFWSMLRTNNR